MHYGSNIQIPVFRCRWIKHLKGVEVDGYGLTIVDLSNIGYKDDTWVLASQVAQVLYVADPTKKTKHVVVPRKQDIIGVEGIDDVEEYNQYDQINLFHRSSTEDEDYRSRHKKRRQAMSTQRWPIKNYCSLNIS